MKKSIINLKYDSELFGYKVVEIVINEANNEELNLKLSTLRKRSVKLVYLKIESYNKQIENIIKENGGFIADVKVLYSCELLNGPFSVDTHNIESVIGIKANDELKNIALEAGAFSRYRKDPNFKKEEFKKLFQDWLRKSLNRQIADFAYIYKLDDESAGLVTAKVKDSILEIGLLSVKKEHRFKKIGSLLIMLMKKIAYDRGLNKINVYTQEDNIPACKFYEKNGFKVISKEYIYHFWLN